MVKDVLLYDLDLHGFMNPVLQVANGIREPADGIPLAWCLEMLV